MRTPEQIAWCETHRSGLAVSATPPTTCHVKFHWPSAQGVCSLSAGWSLHRLDDYPLFEAHPRYGVWVKFNDSLKTISEHFPAGTYALVPVESGETERAAKEKP